MSYIVLARKYRPQNFDEVYAQEHITTILKSAIANNRLAHAFLFTGSRGVGKTSMARILAKSLNCLEEMSSYPCGKCDNCVEITGGTSTDVVEFDGASHTGVEDIRDLQKELMYSTSKSRYKIFIIDEVHMLSKNAFNALLKTLEEPPEQVIFIFATTEPHKVLPTIISRCQRYDFKRIPVDAIVKSLAHICKQESIEIEEDALYVIAKKSEGSLRDALSLTDQLIATSKNKITMNDVLSLFGIVPTDVYHKITEYIYKKETSAIIAIIHSLLDKGNDLQELLGGYLDYLRNLLLIKTKVHLPEISATHKNQLKEIEPLFNEESILYILAILIKTKNDIKYFSNPVLLVEMTFIKLTKMEQMASLSEMLKNWNYSESQPVERQQNTNRNTYYNQSKKSNDSIKEPVKATKKYTTITKEIYEKEKENIIEALNSTGKSILVQYFSHAKLEKVAGNSLYFITDNDLQYTFLNEDKELIRSYLAKFFNLELVVNFRLEKNQKKDTNKKINNPTMKDFERETPNLAKFIELSEANITPMRSSNFRDDSERYED